MESSTRAAGAHDTQLDWFASASKQQRHPCSMRKEQLVSAFLFFTQLVLYLDSQIVDSEWNSWGNKAIDKDSNRQVIIIKKELLDN